MPSPAGPGSQVLNLIHAGLISRGPQKGKVVFLTWDRPTSTSPFGTYWGILDPDLQAAGAAPPMATFAHVAQSALPGFSQHATCVGQSWTPDGRWFLAGGQTPPGPFPASHTDAGQLVQGFGSNLAWIYDPEVVGPAPAGFGAPSGPPTFWEYGAWYAEPAMDRRRYYPTVLLSQVEPSGVPTPNGGEMLVAGGSDDWWNGSPWTPPSLWQDTYEVFRPGARFWPIAGYGGGTWQTRTVSPGVTSRLFPGPTVSGPTGAIPNFHWYPRLFVLPEGRMFNAATEAQSTLALHPTSVATSWANLDNRTTPYVYGYGTAFLYPNFTSAYANTVVNIGGWDYSVTPSGTGTTRVEWANAVGTTPGAWPTGYDWTAAPTSTSLPALTHARAECNAVILPTGDVMVIGDGSPAGVRTPELLQGGQWTVLRAEASVRDHHALTLLLPSGRVLSAGGNSRTYDFQVYAPDYVSKPRPMWGATPGGGVLVRGQSYTVPITLPAGEKLSRVVLMRSGSMTHHADMDQRYVELNLDLTAPQTSSTTFWAPDGPPSTAPGVRAPLGYYMAFLVTQGGVPSVAEFVRFQ